MAEHRKTLEFVGKITRLQYMFGLPYVWEDDRKPKYLKHFNKITTFLGICLVVSDYVSFLTQSNHLTEKQETDRILSTLSHTILISFCFVFEYYKKDIKKLLHKLAVILKTHHNDLVIEMKMIRKAKMYSACFGLTLSYAIISYAVDSIMQVIKSNGTFTPVITAWPDVREKGFWPDVARVFGYFVLCVFAFKVFAVHVYVFSTTTILSHQYRNLQSYFYSLRDIFKKESSEDEKIEEYERSLKLGFWMHAETLWCVEEYQRINTWIFNGQTMFSLTMLCLELLQMAKSNGLMNALSNISGSLAVLLSNGYFMCNAGDITAEKPVVIRSFYVIEFSYETFVSLLKASYSLFSTLY